MGNAKRDRQWNYNLKHSECRNIHIDTREDNRRDINASINNRNRLGTTRI